MCVCVCVCGCADRPQVNASEAQVRGPAVLGEGSDEVRQLQRQIYTGFELFFTFVFSCELFVNMVAHWGLEFWRCVGGGREHRNYLLR